jgi:hypothetical protein
MADRAQEMMETFYALFFLCCVILSFGVILFICPPQAPHMSDKKVWVMINSSQYYQFPIEANDSVGTLKKRIAKKARKAGLYHSDTNRIVLKDMLNGKVLQDNETINDGCKLEWTQYVAAETIIHRSLGNRPTINWLGKHTKVKEL